MGWSFSWDKNFGRKNLIKQLRNPSRFRLETKILESVVLGNRHWFVAEDKDEVWIGLDLMEAGGGELGWGSLLLTERNAYEYTDCPLRFFKKAPCPPGCEQWRDRVRTASLPSEQHEPKTDLTCAANQTALF